MYYILIQTDAGAQLYQEIQQGTLQRFCDMDGNTISYPGGHHIVSEVPVYPEWAKSDIVEVAPVVPANTIISRLEFRNRFTMEEKVLIYSAAKANPLIQIWLDELALAENIDIGAAYTIASVDALSQIGLIAPERVGVILSV